MPKYRKTTRGRRRRKLAATYRGSASTELLRAAATGTLIVGALMLAGGSPISPFWWRHLQKHGDRREDRKRRQRLRQALKRLERRQLIRVSAENKHIRLHLTLEGENLYRQFAFRTLRFNKPKHWDGKWRIVLFDIPEEHRGLRQTLQRTLRHAGCFPLQKSVLVTPVPCRKEIEEIASAFEVPNAILYCETASLGKAEQTARKFFGME